MVWCCSRARESWSSRGLLWWPTSRSARAKVANGRRAGVFNSAKTVGQLRASRHCTGSFSDRKRERDQRIQSKSSHTHLAKACAGSRTHGLRSRHSQVVVIAAQAWPITESLRGILGLRHPLATTSASCCFDDSIGLSSLVRNCHGLRGDPCWRRLIVWVSHGPASVEARLHSLPSACLGPDSDWWRLEETITTGRVCLASENLPSVRYAVIHESRPAGCAINLLQAYLLARKYSLCLSQRVAQLWASRGRVWKT